MITRVIVYFGLFAALKGGGSRNQVNGLKSGGGGRDVSNFVADVDVIVWRINAVSCRPLINAVMISGKTKRRILSPSFCLFPLRCWDYRRIVVCCVLGSPQSFVAYTCLQVERHVWMFSWKQNASSSL